MGFLQLNSGTIFGKIINSVGNLFGPSNLVKPAGLVASAVLPGAGSLISAGLGAIDQQVKNQQAAQQVKPTPAVQNNLVATLPGGGSVAYTPASSTPTGGSFADWVKNNIQVVVASSVGLVLILILLFKK